MMPLFVAQRDDRIDARGAARREVTGEERDAQEHHRHAEKSCGSLA